MDIGIILKVAGVGILVSAASQILSKSGRDEQSTLVTIAGIVVVLIMLIGEIEKLFELEFARKLYFLNNGSRL